MAAESHYTLNDFLAEYATPSVNPQWTAGQTYYNGLCSRRKDLANRLPANLNPFHDDTRVEAFLDWVKEQDWPA